MTLLKITQIAGGQSQHKSCRLPVNQIFIDYDHKLFNLPQRWPKATFNWQQNQFKLMLQQKIVTCSVFSFFFFRFC
mgnify:CR=1 FL=1